MSDVIALAPNAETLAYVAGLFDGEGSIVIGCSLKKADRRNPAYWLQVGITNTDRELIDWLHNTFGGHISDNSHGPSRKEQRPCWAWRIMSKEAKGFLIRILPYLRTKKQQALIAIEFQEHMTACASTKALTTQLVAVREAYRNKLRTLTLGNHSL